MTKHVVTLDKTAQKSDPSHKSGDAAGSSSMSQTPPAYGIDFADSTPIQKIEAAQEPSAGKQAASTNGQPHTGLPDNLKTGIENLSGYAMDDVAVHYNSSKPVQLQALAYTQGTDIYVGPGQERHLPHEAWHVVQQKQGRVKPTLQMKGKMNINDDVALENEADVMGERARGLKTGNVKYDEPKHQLKKQRGKPIIQRLTIDEIQGGISKFGIARYVGDFHEKVFAARDHAPRAMYRRSNDLDIQVLSGGSNKIAFEFAGQPWLLLLSAGATTRQDVIDEIDDLIEIEAAGARIPAMYKVGNSRPNEALNYVFEIEYSEYDERTQIPPSPIYKSKKKGETPLTPTEQTKKEDEKRSANRHRRNWSFMGEFYRQPYTKQYGFLQQRIDGTELGKDENEHDTFITTLLLQDPPKLIISYLDLIRIREAFKTRNGWGDFQLLHEKSTGFIYVFDPNSHVGNGFDPLEVLEDHIFMLDYYMKNGSPNEEQLL